MAGHSIMSRSWAGLFYGECRGEGSLACCRELKSSLCKAFDEVAVELVTVNAYVLITRFNTEMRMGVVVLLICAAMREAVQSKENKTALIGLSHLGVFASC